jgi:SAM-dependent methyltransferase
LVKTNVYRIDGGRTPFADREFDCVVLIDFLEHIADDRGFIQEVHRILRPGGTVIINAPNLKNDLLIRFRKAIGLTDEDHGHLRPGYTVQSISQLLDDNYTVETSRTYTKFFSKFMDTLLVFVLSRLKRNKQEERTGRGVLVTGEEMRDYRAMFRVYSIIYPVVWLFSKMDRFLPFTSGYMVVVKARAKETSSQPADLAGAAVPSSQAA